MKKIFLTLTLLLTSLAYANTPGTTQTIVFAEEDGPPIKELSSIQGPGAQSVPIDDYIGILLVLTVIGSSILYFKKRELFIKK